MRRGNTVLRPLLRLVAREFGCWRRSRGLEAAPAGSGGRLELEGGDEGEGIRTLEVEGRPTSRKDGRI